MECLQTLLTGFGPFGRVVNNPTTRLIEHFQQAEVPGHALVCAVLPVAFRSASERMVALLEIGGQGGKPFDLVLMLGVATGSPHWRVELQGQNHDDALTDAEGFTSTSGPILPDGPEALLASLPFEPQINAIQSLELPVVASANAGAYLCNHVLYTTLHRLQATNAGTQAGFLHVPADEQTFAPGTTSAPMFPFEQHVAAVRAVLEALRDPRQS